MIYRILASFNEQTFWYFMWLEDLRGFIPKLKLTRKENEIELCFLWLYILIKFGDINNGLMLGSTFLAIGIGITKDEKL